ncbi:uncharacterized protein BT62DRAFT_999241 [Guyanagaster necrorhizus]|uniref:Uncharacterized protein n=1 Tax=Guyanagaster necrorhizus TaxID=856835 RepID=A0A9P7W4D1_9AGAR|nr:uncharacterized protein BT62DRAFT_999241 [Guyanagaster necrorhizus MCA 3950]KAG7453196.1 hypothetical protein BT62DRAFT_999241 [Guyanagaster necrorhizus MCA 3950]
MRRNLRYVSALCISSNAHNICVIPHELMSQFSDSSNLALAGYHHSTPTPQSNTDGEQHAPVSYATYFEYVPRTPRYNRDSPCISIRFSVNGNVGPYLEDVLRGQVTIDGAYKPAFEDSASGWSRTKWMLDWPGLPSDCIGLWCHDINKKPLTRDALIREIGAQIGQIMWKSKKRDPRYQQSMHTPHCWRFENIKYRNIRFFSLNYYNRVWIPILAVDMRC